MSILEKAQENVKKHKKEINNVIEKSYTSFTSNLIQTILKLSKEGITFHRFKIGRSYPELTIWNVVPRLLKDERLQGFSIQPKNPDEDDIEITITWY